MFDSLRSKPREINLPYGPRPAKRDRSPNDSSFRTIKLLESNQYDMQQNPLDLKSKLGELKSKVNLGNFKKKNHSVVSHQISPQMSMQTIDPKRFDRAGAANMMQSKHTQSKQNSLFLDTRMFDMISVEYNPDLSKPNALESIDKDYESITRKNSQINLGDVSFTSIRKEH